MAPKWALGYFSLIPLQDEELDLPAAGSRRAISSIPLHPCPRAVGGKGWGRHLRGLRCSSVLPCPQSCLFSALWSEYHFLKHSVINLLPAKLQLRPCCPRNPTFDTIGLRIKSKSLQRSAQPWTIWLIPPLSNLSSSHATFPQHYCLSFFKLAPTPPSHSTWVFYFQSLLL